MATTMLTNSNTTVSRSSFEKARAMKMFSNNRASGDQAANGSLSESPRSHKKSESILSEGMKQAVAAYNIGDQSPTDVSTLHISNNDPTDRCSRTKSSKI
jgi:hypothetical protein